jgi:hypothetical protein
MPDQLDDVIVDYKNRSISGGLNNWSSETDVRDDHATELLDVDIDAPGVRKKRLGYIQVGETIAGSNVVSAVEHFYPSGGVERMIVEFAGNLYQWTGGATFSLAKGGLTPQHRTRLIPAYNRIFRLSQNDTVWSFDGTSWTDEGSVNTSAPQGILGLWTSTNRLLIARSAINGDYVWPSDPIEPQSFDRAGRSLKIASGDNSPIFGMLEWTNYDIVFWKRNKILALSIIDVDPTVWPVSTVASDIGCVAPDSVANVGEDVLFLDIDGVRSLLQSAQDKKRGSGLPLSQPIQGWIDRIHWQYADRAVAKVFGNRYYLAVPIDTSQVNNYVLVYNLLTKGWTIYSNWNVNCWGAASFGTFQKLYFGNSNGNGKVYRGLYGLNDGGSAITYTEATKAIDFGSPETDKVGRIFEVECNTQGGANLILWISVDNGDWQRLGVVDLTGSGPQLAIALPFTLVPPNIAFVKVDLEKFGRFRNVKFKFTEDTVDADCQIRGWYANARLCEFELS